MEGVVHAGQIRDGRLYLNLATRGGTYLVVLPEFPADWEARTRMPGW